MPIPRFSAPKKRRRASAYEPGIHTASVIATTHAEMRNVLPSHVPNLVAVNRYS